MFRQSCILAPYAFMRTSSTGETPFSYSVNVNFNIVNAPAVVAKAKFVQDTQECASVRVYECVSAPHAYTHTYILTQIRGYVYAYLCKPFFFRARNVRCYFQDVSVKSEENILNTS